jgi:nitrile hydratase
MNGVHDMGGMHGFGPVDPTDSEAFHEPWEKRLVGMRSSLNQPIWRPGGFRYIIELLGAEKYLTTGYYERQMESFVYGLTDRGLVTNDEIEARIAEFEKDPDRAIPRVEDPERAKQMVQRINTWTPLHRETGVEPRFKAGDRVRARNINPRGHTRMPRYVRGKTGIIERYYGNHDFPDHEIGGPILPPEALYNVKFTMNELWGEDAEPGDLYIDLWESYMEPASQA